MGKAEASVAGSGLVRPPRPSPRDGARSGTPEPPAAAPQDTEVVVIHPAPDEVEAAAATPFPEGPAVDAERRRTGSLLRAPAVSPDAVTPPLGSLPASPVEDWDPPVLDLPVVALEKPSTTLEPTPSPVPRVSLVPAARDEESERARAGVINSRNVPTVAARQFAPARPFHRQPAAAVTFPPGRALPREGRIARQLAADVRSSKREIVLGLTIGMALAAALGIVGQRYLGKSVPPRGSAPSGGALQELPREPRPPVREEWSLRPPSPPSPAPPSRADSPPSSQPAAASGEAAQAPRRPKVKVTSKQRASAQAPRASAPPPEESRGASDDWMDGSEGRAKAPLSPAESAGLGLDLSL